MKQLLLATALIALPVTAFSGYQMFLAPIRAQVGAGIGDTSAFTGIIADVQAFAAKGDFEAAKTRIKDFEIGWDENAKGLRPLDPATWDKIDGAADTALKAVRATTPDTGAIQTALADLQASLGSPVQATVAATTAAAGLGDTSALAAIITDVQADAQKADFAAAQTRITDFETAWDDKADTLRALDGAAWETVDAAADAALDATRATTPDAGRVTATLGALQAALQAAKSVTP